MYSGDIKYGITDLPRLLGDKKYDLVVCEGAHHPVGTVNDLLSSINTKSLVINHVESVRAQAMSVLKDTALFEFNIAFDGFIKEL